ncbi:MAG: diguanylate cyclase [Wenzhouxiangella sp.]|nr:MAG: diguanylate cyclase [Wenzhouxiangella sp.]
MRRIFAGAGLTMLLLGATLPSVAHGQVVETRPPAADQAVNLVERAELLAEDGQHGAVAELALEALESGSLHAPEAIRLLAVALPAAREARDSDDVERLLAAALSMSNSLADPADIWRLNALLTAQLILQGRFADAERAALAALPYLDGEPPDRQAALLNHLGVARAQQGQLDQALADMHRSLSVLEQAGLDPQPAFLMNMAALSLHLQEFESSIELGERALGMLEGDSALAASLYSNQAVAFIQLDRLDEAEAVLEASIAMGERLGAPNTSAIGNLAFIHRERGEYALALEQFNRQLALDRESGRTDAQPVALKNIGQTLMLMGQHEQAATAFEESLVGYHDVDVRMRRLELYPVMIENLEILGDFQRALALMKEYKELSDEVINVESRERIAELQSRVELERTERELADLEQRRAQGEQELATLSAMRERDRIFLTALILGATALAVIALLLVRTVRLRGKANRLLSAKNDRIELQQRELETLNRQLELSSQHDELTGLGNRRALRTFVDALDAAGRWPEPYLLLLFDLDHFKAINDRHGHEGGDQVLIAFADALSRCAAENDLVVRWGGEEFLWLAGERGIDDAVDQSRRLQAALDEAQIQVDGSKIDLGFSAGGVALPLGLSAPGEQMRDATRLADAALYEAKARGRGCLVMIRTKPNWQALPEGAVDLSCLAEQGVLGLDRRL